MDKDIELEALIDTGVAEKIIYAVTATCVAFGEAKGLTFAGFSDDFAEAIYLNKETSAMERFDYDQVKAEAFEYLESKKENSND